MSNHRPKSLSELNNVYDKALRAEKAIKVNSSLLSPTEDTTPQQGENIFQQLENKTAQAQKNQVFDPDITNIASDFLKRYAQPEKPKPAPTEIKRPAPTIQSVKPRVNKPKQATSPAPAPKTIPTHRPSRVAPATQTVAPKADTVEQTASIETVAQTPTPIQQTPVTEPAAPKAPSVKAPAAKREPVRNTATRRVDHTSIPVPSRVRITSSERSELMEEYMKVMSDDDDEPTYKKSLFSFFKKKKYDDDYDDEAEESIYEDLDAEEEETPDEVPVVAFDSSDVKYDDSYSDLPDTGDTAVTSAPMSLYDYIEADFEYDEDDDDAMLDVSTTTFEKETAETEADETQDEQEDIIIYGDTETPSHPAEEISDDLAKAEDTAEITEEIPQAEELAETAENTPAEDEPVSEEIFETQETDEMTSEATQEVAEETEEATETADENISDYAPPANMEFEDIFSVTDESKRSHTGGDWGVIPVAEAENQSDADSYSEEYDSYDGYEEDSETVYYDEAEDYPKKKKGKGFVKFLLVFFAFVSLTLAAAVATADLVLDIDSGKLISDNFRLFSAEEDMPALNINKGDLIITNNAHAHVGDVYVYTDEADNSYKVGKVISDNPDYNGEYVHDTATQNGTIQVNRNASLGVVITSVAMLGSILSIVCRYGIFIAIGFGLIAIALIVLLIVLRKKKADEYRDYTDEDDSYDGDDSDEEEYYSEYDTDGIEQGLFSDI